MSIEHTLAIHGIDMVTDVYKNKKGDIIIIKGKMLGMSNCPDRVEDTNNKRKYSHKFQDIDDYVAEILSDKELTDIEWEVKECKHNIKILNQRCIAYDFLVKEIDAKEDTLNLRSKG